MATLDYRRGSEGIRRLALVLGVVGAILGGFYARPRFQSLQHRQWHFAYFSEQRKAHPKAKIEKRGREVALVEMPAPIDWAASAKQAGLIAVPPGFTLDKPSSDVSKDPNAGWTLLPPDPPAPIYEQTFPAGSDAPPWRFEYVLLALPVILGFLLPLGAIHATVWVVRGFRLDRVD
jgi:hypothetical protein